MKSLNHFQACSVVELNNVQGGAKKTYCSSSTSNEQVHCDTRYLFKKNNESRNDPSDEHMDWHGPY